MMKVIFFRYSPSLLRTDPSYFLKSSSAKERKVLGKAISRHCSRPLKENKQPGEICKSFDLDSFINFSPSMSEAPAQFCVCRIDCYLCFCLKKHCSLCSAGDPLNREGFHHHTG